MQLTLRDDLPFVSLALTYRGATLTVAQVLIDTGSASTIFAARVVAPIGLLPEMTDEVYTVRGIGGTEAVFTRRMDFLTRAGALINFRDLRLDFAS